MNTVTFRGKQINYVQRPEFWDHLDGWEPETFDVLDRILKPKDHFYDFGAWNGVLSLYAHLLGAIPWAAEPDRVAYMEMNEIVNCNNITGGFYNVAISNEGRDVALYNVEGGWGNSMSSLLQREASWNFFDVVPSITLQGFVEQFKPLKKPALMKMDIEGGEIEVIPKSRSFFEEMKCPFLLSLHPFWFKDREGDTAKIMETLYMAGYDPTKTEFLIHDQLLLFP